MTTPEKSPFNNGPFIVGAIFWGLIEMMVLSAKNKDPAKQKTMIEAKVRASVVVIGTAAVTLGLVAAAAKKGHTGLAITALLVAPMFAVPIMNKVAKIGYKEPEVAK